MKRKVTRISARENKPVQTAQLYHPAVDRRCLAVQFDAYESSFLAERGCFHLPDHEQLHTRIPQSA